MKIETDRFGRLEVEEEEIYHFPQGMIGMMRENRFVFLQQMDQTPFIWLQSVKSPELAFVVTDPWLFTDDYSFNIGTRENYLLQLQEDTNPHTLVTVNLTSLEEISLNLRGPLVFNRLKKLGIQMVLEEDVYPLRYSIPLAVLQSV